jgi:prolyl oligopeptidase
MNKKIPIQFAIIFLLVNCSYQSNDFSYPDSRKDDFKETIHGYEIEDSYRWLEDFTSEDSKDWVKRQNEFTKEFIGTNKYQKSINKNLNKTWDTESISTPYKIKDKTFYYFNDGTWQQSKLMIKDCDACEAQVLLDPNKFSDDGTISLGGTSVSNDGSLLAYSISDGGSDWRTWKVLNINSGETLSDEIYWAKFSSASWENDDSGFYYQKYEEPKDELLKDVNTAPKLMFHKLGTPQSEDQIIFENPNQPRWGWGINVLEDTEVKFLTISNGTDERNRLYVQLKKGAAFIPLIDELIGAYQYLDHKDDLYWFYSTESAKNGKVASLQIKNGSFIWNDLINETANSIRSVNFINNSIAVTYLIDTFSEVQFFSLDGTYLKTLSMEEKGTIAGFGGDLEDTSTFFSYTNFVTPRKIYEIDLENMSKKVFWEENLKGFNSNDYIADFTFL